MLPAILIALLLTLCGCGALILWRLRLWDRVLRRCRQVSMEAVWQSWLSDGQVTAAGGGVRADLLHAVEEGVRESIHKSLLELEVSLRAEAQPMLALRRELMDSIDRRQLNTEILKLSEKARASLRGNHPQILQTDEAAHVYILANDLRIAVLREYAGLHYGDFVEGDWFDVYQKASRLRQRGTRSYIERALGGAQTASDDIRFQTMALMDGEIRTRLLQIPAGTRFPGFGKNMSHNSGQF